MENILAAAVPDGIWRHKHERGGDPQLCGMLKTTSRRGEQKDLPWKERLDGCKYLTSVGWASLCHWQTRETIVYHLQVICSFGSFRRNGKFFSRFLKIALLEFQIRQENLLPYHLRFRLQIRYLIKYHSIKRQETEIFLTCNGWKFGDDTPSRFPLKIKKQGWWLLWKTDFRCSINPPSSSLYAWLLLQSQLWGRPFVMTQLHEVRNHLHNQGKKVENKLWDTQR